MVDTVDERLGVFRWRRDDHLLRAADRDVNFCRVDGGEFPGALEDVFGAPCIPGQLCRIPFTGEDDPVFGEREVLFPCRGVIDDGKLVKVWVAAVCRVVLECEEECFGCRGRVVDRDDYERTC